MVAGRPNAPGPAKRRAALAGPDAARSIDEIEARKKADLTDDDDGHGRMVVGYVRRHRAKGGKSRDDPESAWKLSLMDRRYDPSKA